MAATETVQPSAGSQQVPQPTGNPKYLNFIASLRRLALQQGLETAVERCKVEGAVLAGQSVYCHPVNDRFAVRTLIEIAGGNWLEDPPDAHFLSAVPCLVLTELQEVTEGWPQQMMWTQGYQAFGGDSFIIMPETDGMSQPAHPVSFTSREGYLETSLKPEDAEGYTAAGLQVFRRAADGSIELLLAHERPWNSHINDYDPLAWNVVGGKRGRGGFENDARQTATRCLLEVIGGIELCPHPRAVKRMCWQSTSVWYPRGKFVLFLHELIGDDLDMFATPDFSMRYQASLGQPRTDRFRSPWTKYPKEIYDFEWVSASDLLDLGTAALNPSARMPIADLLENILSIGDFQNFLVRGTLPLAAEEPPLPAWEFGKPYRKGKGKRAGWDVALNCGSKGDDWDKSKGKGGDGKVGQKENELYADAMAILYEGVKGPGKKGGKMSGKPSGGYSSYGNGKAAKAAKGKSKSKSGIDDAAAERQRIGEELYLKVQDFAPSKMLAQKLTGMLMALPAPELLPLLAADESGRAELEARVTEGLAVLQADGYL